MSEHQPLSIPMDRKIDVLVLGRAGMDLYPEPDGRKIKDAKSFSCDLGGSGGLIATAAARAGGNVGLISALSDDAVGQFVRNRLAKAGVDSSYITDCREHSRTSLALAEVRNDDCDVVIYRNSAADLDWQYTDALQYALPECANLVVTGTCLIDQDSRRQALKLMRDAQSADCTTWLDLDYRAWNWPDASVTRQVYREAASVARVLVGNEEELAVLDDSLDARISDIRERNQVMILKRGGEGATVFCGDATLETGVYPVKTLKPYGSGDAFLGNLIIAYQRSGDWIAAIETGTAAAALVVSQRGCASVMPGAAELIRFRTGHTLTVSPNWR